MKANEFVKRYGVAEAKRVLHDARGCTGVKLWGRYEFSTDDLKRLIESHELTFLFGDDISYAKKYLKEMLFKFREDMEFYVEDDCRSYSLLELKQAIADVESCQ